MWQRKKLRSKRTIVIRLFEWTKCHRHWMKSSSSWFKLDPNHIAIVLCAMAFRIRVLDVIVAGLLLCWSLKPISRRYLCCQQTQQTNISTYMQCMACMMSWSKYLAIVLILSLLPSYLMTVYNSTLHMVPLWVGVRRWELYSYRPKWRKIMSLNLKRD